MNIRDKIFTRLNQLEVNLQNGKHLGSAEEIIDVLTLIDSVSKFWRILNDDERDLLNAARYALEEQKAWQ